MTISFFVMWWAIGDFKESAILILCFICGFSFNYNLIYTYRSLKRNRFNIKLASDEINWPYILISTPIIVIASVTLLPYTLKIALAIISLCLLVGLFLLDFIIHGLK